MERGRQSNLCLPAGRVAGASLSPGSRHRPQDTVERTYALRPRRRKPHWADLAHHGWQVVRVRLPSHPVGPLPGGGIEVVINNMVIPSPAISPAGRGISRGSPDHAAQRHGRHGTEVPHARSLTRLNCAVFRDDVGEGAGSPAREIVQSHGSICRLTLLVSVPPGVATSTGPLVAPEGTIAPMNVSEITLKVVAGTPLNVTAVAPVRPVPRICTPEPTWPNGSTKVTKGPRPMSRLKTVPSLPFPPPVVVP